MQRKAELQARMKLVDQGMMPKLEGADAMHAWASVWCGDDAGWIGFDPTNDMLAGTDHIVLAIGRDYADVAPMDGVIFASGAQRLETSVRVQPVG